MLDDDAAALNSKKNIFFFIYVELKLTILNSVGQLFPKRARRVYCLGT